MLDHETPHANYLASSADKKALEDSQTQFHLSKLLVPGVQIQTTMYLNSPDVWIMRWDGARTLRLTEADVNVKFY